MWLDLIEFGENLTRMPGTQEIRDLEPLSILSEMAEAAIRKKLYPNEPICAPDGRVLLP